MIIHIIIVRYDFKIKSYVQENQKNIFKSGLQVPVF